MIARIPRVNLPSNDVAGATQSLSELLTDSAYFQGSIVKGIYVV